MSTLDQIQEGHDEYAAKASGLFNRMENFDTFSFHILYLHRLSSVPQTFKLSTLQYKKQWKGLRCWCLTLIHREKTPWSWNIWRSQALKS